MSKSRIALLDDYEAVANLIAAPLRLDGYRVQVETVPIDFEHVVEFAPQLIVIALYRAQDAFNRPIKDAKQDIIGYSALIEVEDYPALNVLPILLIGDTLDESDIPTTIAYDLFLSFPRDVADFTDRVEELTDKVKTRRKISSYRCPLCRSRLTYLKDPEVDLFCPRCHTAVTLVDRENCYYMPAESLEHVPCKIAQLLPPNRKS